MLMIFFLLFTYIISKEYTYDNVIYSYEVSASLMIILMFMNDCMY